MFLRMRAENPEHPGSAGPCQASEKELAWAWARAVISATCGSAEFFYPTPCRQRYVTGRRKGEIWPASREVAFRSLILDGLIHPEQAVHGVAEVETRY